MSDEQTTRPESVLVRREGAVAVVSFNRTESRNSWSSDMENMYFDTLEVLAEDPDVKAVVLAAEGADFSVGADMASLDLTATTEEGKDVLKARRQIYPLSFPKPLVCAIQGACAGVGLVQALMCDVRFSVPDATFTTAFSRIGLIAEHSISWLLPKHIGMGAALDLLMSARRFDGREAARLGVVNHLSEPETLLADAVAYAKELADRVSPASMATIKSQVYRHYTMDLVPSLDESDELMLQTLRGPDFAEGVSSFIEKRRPRFSSLSRSMGAPE